MKYQLCPKCQGQGTVNKPPWVQGDIFVWISSSCSFPCDVCFGVKIIAVPDYTDYTEINDLARQLVNQALPLWQGKLERKI